MAFLYLGEHGLVDVEGLIDDLDRLTGLLFVPLLEFTNEILIDVVSPVVDFQDVIPVRRAGRYHERRGEDAE